MNAAVSYQSTMTTANFSYQSVSEFSPRAEKAIRNLPESDRNAIVSALKAEYLFGANPDEMLTPVQAILYCIIKSYIDRDLAKA